MPTLIPDQSGDVTFTVSAYDEDGDTLTLSSFTVLTIDGVPQGSNPAWLDAPGVVTSTGTEEVDGRYRLDVTFAFNESAVTNGVYVIELTTTDGTVSVSSSFSLDVQATTFIPVPTDVSGLTGWFAAEFETIYNDSDPIDFLTNQVVANPNAEQDVTDNKPTFVENDAELNNFSSIQFDGSNDYLRFAYNNASTTYTIFAVASLDSGTASGDRVIFNALSLFDDESAKLHFEADGEDIRLDYYDGNGALPPTSVTLGELLARSGGMHIYSGVFDDATTGYHKIFRDGVIRMYWDSSAGAFNRNLAAVDFGFGLQGRIAEMLVYNRALTSQERQLVEIYLASKYDMPIGPNPDYDPTETSGLHAWYHADSITDVTGDLVNTWPDSSGNSRNLTSAGALRPTRVVGTAAGRNVVRFAGAESMQTAAWSPVVPDEATMFVVVRSDNLTSNTYTVIDGRQNGFRHRIELLQPQTVQFNQGSGNVSGSRDTSDYTVICAQMAATDTLWVNDEIVGTGTGGSDNLDGITIGSDYTQAANFLVGDIAEIVIFDRTLTEGEVISMNNYLAWKYGTDFSYRSPNP